MTVLRSHLNKHIKWINIQRKSHYNHEVAIFNIFSFFEKIGGKRLSRKFDLRFNWPLANFIWTLIDLWFLEIFLKLLWFHRIFALAACSTFDAAIWLAYFLGINSCLILKVVNVLCKIHCQQTFDFQELDEEVGRSWVVILKIKSLQKLIEELRIFNKRRKREQIFIVIYNFLLYLCLHRLWWSKIWNTSA